MDRLVAIIYFVGNFATFIYLTFFDGYVYTAWNWLVAIPANILLSSIWPLYWAFLHWVL